MFYTYKTNILQIFFTFVKKKYPCLVLAGHVGVLERPLGAARSEERAESERRTSGERPCPSAVPSAAVSRAVRGGQRWRSRRSAVAVAAPKRSGRGWRLGARASLASASCALPPRCPEHLAAGDGTWHPGRTARTRTAAGTGIPSGDGGGSAAAGRIKAGGQPRPDDGDAGRRGQTRARRDGRHGGHGTAPDATARKGSGEAEAQGAEARRRSRPQPPAAPRPLGSRHRHG